MRIGKEAITIGAAITGRHHDRSLHHRSSSWPEVSHCRAGLHRRHRQPGAIASHRRTLLERDLPESSLLHRRQPATRGSFGGLSYECSDEGSLATTQHHHLSTREKMPPRSGLMSLSAETSPVCRRANRARPTTTATDCCHQH
nr:hypothetical protein Itr_chr04CG17230 [Ipomoea trifida]